MKTLYTVIAALSLTVVSTANAQSTDGGVLPEIRVALPPELASCVAACTAVSASPRPADHSRECAGVTDTSTRSRIERMSTEIHRISTEVNAHTRALETNERRLRTLESQVGLLSSRTADLDRQVRELREEVAAIRREIATLHRSYELVMRDYVDLAVRVGVLEEDFHGMEGTVGTLSTRVSDLESRIVSVRIGVRTGLLVLGSFDRTLYTGLLTGPQLTLQLSPQTRVMLEGGVPLSISREPVGSFVRGSLGYDFTPNWSLEGGVISTWVGYNSRLEARSAFLMGDVGVRFRLSWFNVTANVMAGSEFDQGSPSFALGGLLLVGGEWP